MFKSGKKVNTGRIKFNVFNVTDYIGKDQQLYEKMIASMNPVGQNHIFFAWCHSNHPHPYGKMEAFMKKVCDYFSYVEVSDEDNESCQNGAIDERLKNNEKEIAALKETVKHQQKTMNNLEQKLERNQCIIMKFLDMYAGVVEFSDVVGYPKTQNPRGKNPTL